MESFLSIPKVFSMVHLFLICGMLCLYSAGDERFRKGVKRWDKQRYPASPNKNPSARLLSNIEYSL